MVTPVIEMSGISKQYTLVAGAGVPVLGSIDLKIMPGEFVTIMGPSGSGKSTLMNLLGTLDKPSAGYYALDGENTVSLSDTALARIRNRSIGFIFQGFNLLPRRTIIDNIMLPLAYAGLEHAERQRRADYYLERVGLSSHRNYFPTQLSGGQQQRIAIARALAGDPKLLLADEPTGNLDSHTGTDIMTMLTELNAQGMTIVLVTHEDDVGRYGKRLVRLRDGAITYDGKMDIA